MSNQVKHLAKLGCDLVQGFYFSKPISSQRAEAFMQATEITRSLGNLSKAIPDSQAKRNPLDTADQAHPVVEPRLGA